MVDPATDNFCARRQARQARHRSQPNWRGYSQSSGKKHRPGANVQAVMLPGGLPIWTSPAEPGRIHDITAARAHVLPLLYRAAAAGMPTPADGGYEGAGIGIRVPVKNPPGNQRLDPGTKTRNALLRGLRSQGERGFALLSQRWTTLQRITASPRNTTEIVQAALVLTQFEHKYLTELTEINSLKRLRRCLALRLSRLGNERLASRQPFNGVLTLRLGWLDPMTAVLRRNG